VNYFRKLLKMFYFFQAKPLPEPKVQERSLSRAGKLFLIAFTVSHLMFLIFNMYYFMPNTNEVIENNTNPNEATGNGIENEI